MRISPSVVLTTHLTWEDNPVRINGIVLTAVIALGVVITYDKVKSGSVGGGMRKGV